MNTLYITDLPYKIMTFDNDEMVDYMLDKHADKLVKNVGEKPFVEYGLDDIDRCWQDVISNTALVEYMRINNLDIDPND